MNEIIYLRGEAMKELNRWFGERCIAPMISACKEQGMSDDETNLAINRALFDAFQGLHGFPDNQRP